MPMPHERLITKALKKVEEARTLLDAAWPNEEAQALRLVLTKAQSRMDWLRHHGAQAIALPTAE